MNDISTTPSPPADNQPTFKGWEKFEILEHNSIFKPIWRGRPDYNWQKSSVEIAQNGIVLELNSAAFARQLRPHHTFKAIAKMLGLPSNSVLSIVHRTTAVQASPSQCDSAPVL